MVPVMSKAIVVVLFLAMCAGMIRAQDASPQDTPPAEPAKEVPRRQLFHGQVITLGEALKRRDIAFSEEVANHLVLDTGDGELIPILADWRGRAFYQDERLRNRDVDLVAIRRPGIPYLQVLMVYTFDDEGRRQFTDYWCDICAIAMYEIKLCECCQGDIRLRFRPQELPDDVRKSERDDATRK